VLRPQAADFSSPAVRSETAIISAAIAPIFLLAILFIDGIFDASHGAEPRQQSMTRKRGICVAREKHRVSTGNFATEFKLARLEGIYHGDSYSLAGRRG
jgi:hypothetical protein